MADRFYIKEDGMKEAIVAARVVPTKMASGVQQAAARNVGTIVRQARKNFRSSIIRDRSTGWRQEDRMTGNFTFGTGQGEQGGDDTFLGRNFKEGKYGFGFGFPDVQRADSQTNFVWRSLEHGLPGSRRGKGEPSSRGLFELYPLGSHILPKRFSFDADYPSGRLHLRGKFNRTEEARAGGGIEGKHFIEDAWITSFPFFEARYKRAFDKVMRTIAKRQ